MIYLDHNASSPLRPEAFAAMQPWMTAQHGNAQSVHRAGRLARHAVDEARAQIAALAGCRADEVIFTSGATEADNWALRGLMPGTPRYVGAAEHDAVLQAMPGLRTLRPDPNGVISPAALAQQLEGRAPGLVSLMWANNETGVCNDIAALAAVAAGHGSMLHSDAAQALGRVPLDFAGSGCVALSLSAHKLGGPLGVGALVLREGTAIEPLLRGGQHEGRRRAGTLNVPGIVGFGAACARLAATGVDEARRLQGLRDQFEQALLAQCPGAQVFGQQVPRLPNTSFFAVPGWHSEALLMALDREGLALASGSACHSGSDVPSHVLQAMGVPTQTALGAVRMSLGHTTQDGDVAALLAALLSITGGGGAGRFAGVMGG